MDWDCIAHQRVGVLGAGLCLFLLAGGCLRTVAATECPDGSFCAAGLECVDNGAGEYQCALATCGDGIVDTLEECDDGESLNSDAPNARCRLICQLASCGDGIIDVAPVDGRAAEECDDENSDSTDTCIQCRLARCGDGFLQDGVEVCDDGNQNINDDCPDGVDGTCQPARCGDGLVKTFRADPGDTTEECDCGDTTLSSDPANPVACVGINSSAANAACRQDCTASRCGDGIIDDAPAGGRNPEACDDGASNSDSIPDACRLDCSLPACGDGITDSGEECDEGAANSNSQPDACRLDCRLSYCGDGVVDADEACDDGNNDDNDGCSATCQDEECGDGVAQPDEACDDGVNNSNTQPDACRLDCTLPRCGDNVVDSGELCDDGNLIAGDGCSSTCQLEGCGNGIVTFPELCDDGDNNRHDACPDGPGGTCQPAACGDGSVYNEGAGTEECDDGNLLPNDGCNGCVVEPGWNCVGQPSLCAPVCGDGLIRGGEVCDDGNNTDDDGCSAGCVVEPGWACVGVGGPSLCTPVCGDGVRLAAEPCDDGNVAGGDGCSAACTVENGWVCDGGSPTICSTDCGDGIWVAGVEGCDDGNNSNGDGCSALCLVETGYVCVGSPSVCTTACGDGVRAAGEECDDGDTLDGDGCSSTCAVEQHWLCVGMTPDVCDGICGDGHRRGTEACDDDNNSAGDGCSAACTVENGWTCAGLDPDVCLEVCGDGLVVGSELCDGVTFPVTTTCNTELGGGTVCSGAQDEFGGLLVCNATCDGIDSTQCYAACCDDNDCASDLQCLSDAGVDKCLPNGDLCDDSPPVLTDIGLSGSQLFRTTNFHDRYNPNNQGSCGPVSTGNSDAPDQVLALDLTAGQYVVIDVRPVGNWDSMVYISDACPGIQSGCQIVSQRDDGTDYHERLDFVAPASQRYYLVVDGDHGWDYGDYLLTWDIGGGQTTPGFPGEVIITEIMPQPGGCDGGNGEWFEVLNPTGGAFDLDTIRFVSDDGSFTVNRPLILRPSEYLVLGLRFDASDNCGNEEVSWHYSGTGFNLQSSPGGDYRIAVETGAAVVIDEVSYRDESAAVMPWPYGTGRSMYLCTNHLDPVENDDATNWAMDNLSSYSSSDPQTGTPAAANPAPCN